MNLLGGESLVPPCIIQLKAGRRVNEFGGPPAQEAAMPSLKVLSAGQPNRLSQVLSLSQAILSHASAFLPPNFPSWFR